MEPPPIAEIPPDVVAGDTAVRDVEHRLDADERTEQARVEHLSDLIDIGVVAPVVGLHHDDVATAGGIGDPLRVVGVRRERLLAEHVLAGLDRRDRRLAVIAGGVPM